MRRPLATTALLLTGLALAFAVGECSVRGLEATGWIEDERAALFPKVTPRGKFVRSENALLRFELDPSDPLVSADGFRGDDVSVERGDAPRVLALGDSVTFGRGVPAGATWPEVLESRLRQDVPGSEVLNFGVGGYNARQVVERYRLKGRRYRPDLVVFGFVLNDCFPARALLDHARSLRDAGGPGPRGPGAGRAERAWPASRLLALVRRRLAALEQPNGPGAPPVFIQMCAVPELWAGVRDALSDLARMAREDDAKLLLAIFPMMEDFDAYPYRALHQRIGATARRQGIEVLDLLPAFAGHDALTLRLLPSDTTHPNAEGQRIAADALYAHLRARGTLATMDAPAAR